jgi:type III secretory pathway lipoprotein EscJ
VLNTNTMVSDIHHIIVKSQEGVDCKNASVSIARSISITERTLTIAQTQIRSAISTADESNILYSHLACLESYHHYHQGSSLDGTK